jgi:hypothetical protein
MPQSRSINNYKPAIPYDYIGLQPSHKRLVDEYLVDLNIAQAAQRCNINLTTAEHIIRRDDVQRAVKERRTFLDSGRALKGAKFVLDKLWEVATADPRDLVQIWKLPCRFCWGLNGRYQFTKAEFDRLLKAHEYGLSDRPFDALWPRSDADRAAWVCGKNRLGLDTLGGDGYTTRRDPNPNCTECAGQGVTINVTADTRKLSKGAQALYRGVKLDKQGRIEVLMANADIANGLLAKHYGIIDKHKAGSGESMTIDPSTLSEEELAQAITHLEQMVDGEFTVIESGAPVEQIAPRKLTRPVG